MRTRTREDDLTRTTRTDLHGTRQARRLVRVTRTSQCTMTATTEGGDGPPRTMARARPGTTMLPSRRLFDGGDANWSRMAHAGRQRRRQRSSSEGWWGTAAEGRRRPTRGWGQGLAAACHSPHPRRRPRMASWAGGAVTSIDVSELNARYEGPAGVSPHQDP